MKKSLLVASVALGLALPSAAAPKVKVSRGKPFNLYEPGRPISLRVKGDPGKITVTDYYGRAVPFTFKDGELVVGDVPAGYYEIRHAGGMNSFGVAPFTKRTAAEALKEGSRFGLKVFQIGEPGVWWRRPLTWELDECVGACEALGLQWTRHGLSSRPDPSQPGVIGTVDLVTKHRMNCVMKVEGMPPEAYDEKRYGPRDAFAKTHNKRGYSRCSVPLKEPYQAWLRAELKKLPPSQKTFEIGNEVWDYMSAEEFAEFCRLTVPVIRETVPGCTIGVDPGNLAWGRRFAKAGGFDGVDAMYIHPYSFTPMPEVRIRALLRNSRETWERLAGRKLDVYVTEYGWPTAPKDRRRHSVDERTQAQRTTRESLMLYAEDCRTLIPHWMADREQDPTEREHWFGFFRLCGEPKPVVMAHAACARMIDGSVFLGDLVLPGAEKGVGSMLFRKGKEWIVALWTLDEKPGAGREVVLPVRDARVYGIMGDERPAKRTAKGLAIRASGDVTYVVGKGTPAAAFMRHLDRTGELSATRWFNRVGGDKPGYTVGRDKPSALAMKPLDGQPGETCTGEMWHAGKDLNVRVKLPRACLAEARGRLVVRFSTRPERQLEMGGTAVYDYAIVAEFRKTVPAVSLEGAALKTAIKPVDGVHESGVKYTVAETADGLVFEMRVPKKVLLGWGDGRDGLMSGIFVWWSGKRKWASAGEFPAKPYDDPLWKLEK